MYFLKCKCHKFMSEGVFGIEVLYLLSYIDMIFHLYNTKSIISLIILSKLLFKIYIYYILLTFVS